MSTFLTIFASVFSSNMNTPHDSIQKVEVDGIKRKYLLHVPALGSNTDRVPLVLVLHGAGGTADGAAKHYGWKEKSDEESFIVVFPEALPLDTTQPSNFKRNPNVWNDGSTRKKNTHIDDSAFLRQVIEEVSQRYKVDPKGIYMTGFSNGASMTFKAGIDLSNLLAAIAPVSGHLWLKNPRPKRVISLMLITGDSDPMNPLKGGRATNPWSPLGHHSQPMEDSVKIWAQLLKENDKNAVVVDLNGVKIKRYGPNSSGQEALFIVVPGQGHEWPGSDRLLPLKTSGPNVKIYNATNAIWDFFSIHEG